MLVLVHFRIGLLNIGLYGDVRVGRNKAAGIAETLGGIVPAAGLQTAAQPFQFLILLLGSGICLEQDKFIAAYPAYFTAQRASEISIR